MLADYPVVVFDLDDTLMDHTSASRQALLAWSAERGRAVTDMEADLTRWKELMAQAYELYVAGACDFEGMRRYRVRHFLPEARTWDDEQATAAFGQYLQHYSAQWIALPGAVDVVSALRRRGQRVVVLTNGEYDHQFAKLVAIGLADEIDGFFPSATLPAAKPDLAAYRAVTQTLGVQPAQCCMIGDSLPNDIAGPLAAGWHAIWLRSDSSVNDVVPDGITVISSLTELM